MKKFVKDELFYKNNTMRRYHVHIRFVRLVSIFMSTLQCVQVVGITLSSSCMTVRPPWQILLPGLLYFNVNFHLKAGKIVSRGNRTQDHRYAEHAHQPLGHASSVPLIIVHTWITVHAWISVQACAPANLT